MVTATEAGAGKVTQEVAITVTDVNEAPMRSPGCHHAGESALRADSYFDSGFRPGGCVRP